MSELIKKDLKGYEGYYYITPEGHVHSHDRHITARGQRAGRRFRKGKKISSYKHNINGFETVQLYKKNKRKIFYVHKLMARAFFDSARIEHIDGNLMNNNIFNLRKKVKKTNVQTTWSISV